MEKPNSQNELLWERCQKVFKDNVTPAQYEASFAFVKLHSFEGGQMVLDVPSDFVKRMLEREFIPLMGSTFKRVFGEGAVRSLYYNVAVVGTHALPGGSIREKAGAVAHAGSHALPDMPIRREGDTHPSICPSGVKVGTHTGIHALPDMSVRHEGGSMREKAQAPGGEELDSQLYAPYTFENYIEGDSNRLARAVGESLAEGNAKTFNPFFVFGPSGCGKTHLITAIGLRAKSLHPEMRVLYLSAHLFTVQYTDAVMRNTVNDFIRFYQTIDMLILDDVQELAGKAQTQNTFFHIFNHLQVNGKQIILSADRPPIAIKGLEDRLLTRFKWGMQAQIERPTQALRFDILAAKVDKEGLHIPQTVLRHISENVSDSVRDLEGMVNSLMAYSVVYNCPINMALVQKVMPRFAERQERQVTVGDIKHAVCDHFHLKESMLDSRSRTQKVAYARQIAMYLANSITSKSHAQIGLDIGNRNHATVIHAIKQVRNLMEVNERTRQDVEALTAMVRS